MNKKDDRGILYRTGLEIPEPWASRMLEVGLIDPRPGYDPKPSYRALSDKAGLNVGTVSRLISGKKDPRRASPETLSSMAKALQIPVTEMREWFQFEENSLGDQYIPPPTSRLLTTKERSIIDDMIHALVRNRLDEES